MRYPDSTAALPAQHDAARADARPWAGEPEQIEAFRPYLLGVANKEIAPGLRPKGGASDIVQDTLMEAYRDLGQFSGRTPAELKGWLRRILRNNLANFARRYTGSAKRRVGREVSIDGQPGDRLTSAIPSPSGQAIRREQAEILEQAMAQAHRARPPHPGLAQRRQLRMERDRPADRRVRREGPEDLHPRPRPARQGDRRTTRRGAAVTIRKIGHGIPYSSRLRRTTSAALPNSGCQVISGRPVGEAVAEVFQGVAGHVRALVAGAGDAGDGVIAVPRHGVLQLPEHVRLGGDEEVARVVEPGDVPDHRLGAADEVALLADVRRALRVRHGQRLGEPPLEPEQVADAEQLVDHARAFPEDHRAAGHFRPGTGPGACRGRTGFPRLRGRGG